MKKWLTDSYILPFLFCVGVIAVVFLIGIMGIGIKLYDDAFYIKLSQNGSIIIDTKYSNYEYKGLSEINTDDGKDIIIHLEEVR